MSQNQEKLNLFQNKIKEQKNMSELFKSKNYTKNLENAYFEAYDNFINQNPENIDLT